MYIHIAKLKTVLANLNRLNAYSTEHLIIWVTHDQLHMITSTGMVANLFCNTEHDVNQH